MQNRNLIDDFMSPEAYNKLPHIDQMRNASELNADALEALLSLIRQHGHQDKFSVHLLHKHFDAPEDCIMVYETKAASEHPNFMVFRPLKQQDAHGVRGLYYQAQPGGKMSAYEYTQDIGEDVSAHADFVSAFSNMCFELGVQQVFALTVRQAMDTAFDEIEWAEFNATLLFPEDIWHPSQSEIVSTATDWSSPAGPSVPGIIELNCLKTRSARHYNVTCSKTRAGTHYQKKKNANADVPVHDTPYELDGEQILPGTDMFKVFSAAYQTLAVAVC